MRLDDGFSVVSRGVVGNDYFEISVSLAQRAFERRSQVGVSTVVGRNSNCYEWKERRGHFENLPKWCCF